MKIGQSSDKMYRNNIQNFQESTPVFNACIKKSGNLLHSPYVFMSLFRGYVSKNYIIDITEIESLGIIHLDETLLKFKEKAHKDPQRDKAMDKSSFSL